MLCPADW